MNLASWMSASIITAMLLSAISENHYLIGLSAIAQIFYIFVVSPAVDEFVK